MEKLKQSKLWYTRQLEKGRNVSLPTDLDVEGPFVRKVRLEQETFSKKKIGTSSFEKEIKRGEGRSCTI